jgi:hypothetical protein
MVQYIAPNLVHQARVVGETLGHATVGPSQEVSGWTVAARYCLPGCGETAEETSALPSNTHEDGCHGVGCGGGQSPV